jgi:hypothetical protein
MLDNNELSSCPFLYIEGLIVPAMSDIESGPWSHFEITDPAGPLTGLGDVRTDLRAVAWSESSGESAGAYITGLRQQARDALQVEMGTGNTPTQRDLNELDRQLELMMVSVGGNRHRGYHESPYFYVSEEVDRVAMPHYAVDARMASQYNIRNSRPNMVDATAEKRDPASMVVMLAVALTLPYTKVSKRDDETFKKEKWRAHTHTDVVIGSAAHIPVYTTPQPTNPHTSTLKGNENMRFDAVTEHPIFPDGHSAWFEGWDKFLDTPFPEEAPL